MATAAIQALTSTAIHSNQIENQLKIYFQIKSTQNTSGTNCSRRLKMKESMYEVDNKKRKGKKKESENVENNARAHILYGREPA